MTAHVLAQIRAAHVLDLRDLSWHDRAACQYVDPDLWFPEGSGVAEATSVQADQARGICLGCPVRRDCLSQGLSRPEPFGIWGGLTERELRAERQRPRRPLAEILADADARYFRRQDTRIAANERRLAAGRRRRQEPVPVQELAA